jgi:hypothetical protein
MQAPVRLSLEAHESSHPAQTQTEPAWHHREREHFLRDVGILLAAHELRNRSLVLPMRSPIWHQPFSDVFSMSPADDAGIAINESYAIRIGPGMTV